MLSQRTGEFVILCKLISLLGMIVFKKAKLRLNCAHSYRMGCATLNLEE